MHWAALGALTNIMAVHPHKSGSKWTTQRPPKDACTKEVLLDPGAPHLGRKCEQEPAQRRSFLAAAAVQRLVHGAHQARHLVYLLQHLQEWLPGSAMSRAKDREAEDREADQDITSVVHHGAHPARHLVDLLKFWQ